MRAYKEISPSKRNIVLAEIEKFMGLARGCADKEMAKKYVRKARNSGMKHKVKFPLYLKKRFCKHCHAYLKPGINLLVRMRKGMVIYHCQECKGMMRFRH